MTNEFEQIHEQGDKTRSFLDSVELLFRETGFRPTPELGEATEAVLRGLRNKNTDKSTLQQAWIELAKITEKIVESPETNPDEYDKAQIAAILYKASLFHRAGDAPRYILELDIAEVYAFNRNLDQLSTAVASELDKVCETLEMSSEVLIVKLKGILDESSREHLRDLLADGDDFEDMVNNAHAMMLDEGADPDEVLTSMGILGP
jgi:hypothetical protein